MPSRERWEKDGAEVNVVNYDSANEMRAYLSSMAQGELFPFPHSETK